jgi:hypothetical protein
MLHDGALIVRIGSYNIDEARAFTEGPAEEFIDAGDRVLAILRLYAQGRSSGVNVERLDGAVWTLSAGMCVRLDYYGSSQQALKAVGLKE